MLKKDNFILGMVIGLVLPALMFGILSAAKLFVETGTAWTRPFETQRMIILSIIINVIPLRWYFVKYKFENSGKGVLLTTFLMVVVYFLINRYF
jgi:hypothetical protein